MFYFEEHCYDSFQCSIFNGVVVTLFSFVILPSWHFCEITTLLKENHPFSGRMRFQQLTIFYGET